MCRYDDGDVDWYVDSTNHEAVSDKVERCEDCGRSIAAGEIHTVFTAMENEYGDDVEGKWMWVAQEPQHCRNSIFNEHEYRYFDESKPFFRITEDDDEAYVALGFKTFDQEDDPDYEPKIEYHVSCAHCVIANRWLIKICGQHTVMCTVEDLRMHTDEYDAETLGSHFMQIHGLSQLRWQTPSPLTGGTYLVGAGWLSETVDLAIEHAISKGLQEAH